MNQHVLPNKNDWGVKSEQSSIVRKFETQDEAIEFARRRAKEERSQLIIHGTNGRICQRIDYGDAV